jgi:hypothetical protein
MAARKRSTRKRTVANRRHRVSPKRRAAGLKAARTRRNKRHRVTLVNRRHRRNPAARRVTRHRRRRSNPGLLAGAGGLLENAITGLVGAGITDFAYGFVGSMNPAGMIGQVGIKLGIAMGIRMAANRFGFARHANMLAIGGAISAGKDFLNYAVGGGGILFPQPTAVPGRAALPAAMTGDDVGMSDIVAVPSNWGQLGDIVQTDYPLSWFQ